MCNDLKSLKQAIPTYIFKKIESLSSDESEQLIMCEEFIERAGIMEYDGMQIRFMAHQNALICVERNFKTRTRENIHKNNKERG
jgi:hypothetical protein